LREKQNVLKKKKARDIAVLWIALFLFVCTHKSYLDPLTVSSWMANYIPFLSR